MKITDAVREIAEPVIENVGGGIELIDTEYVKEGPDWYLRIYIDKKGGVTLDDCQAVSEVLSDILDEKDLIKGKYIFEVSSPGIDRPLKTDADFTRYKGEFVEVHLYAPLDKCKVFTGRLVGRDNGGIVISVDGEEQRFEEKNVSLVKRTIIWD